MNNGTMHRMMLRDQNREQRSIPQMHSNEYAMGRRVYDRNTRNRYSPRGMDSRESDYEQYDRAYSEPDYRRGTDRAMRDREYDGHHIYPFEVAGRFAKEHYPFYDYMSDSPYLSEHELNQWAMRLLHSIDEKYKDTLKKERIIKEAEEVGIHFDKFTKDEFYVVVLMMYTDFCKTLGTANFDVYLKLAKDWLCDDDIAVKYSEKLAAYYDNIVEGI